MIRSCLWIRHHQSKSDLRSGSDLNIVVRGDQKKTTTRSSPSSLPSSKPENWSGSLILHDDWESPDSPPSLTPQRAHRVSVPLFLNPIAIQLDYNHHDFILSLRGIPTGIKLQKGSVDNILASSSDHRLLEFCYCHHSGRN